MPSPNSFLFLTCQIGAEGAVKGEMARRWPEFRFSYSRPGFLTFKLPENVTFAEDLDLESVFARAMRFRWAECRGTIRPRWRNKCGNCSASGRPIASTFGIATRPRRASTATNRR